jgi:transcriptional regulator of acetoin/glycerol metabolism
VRPFFCVAAPVDAPDGQRLGVLDITSYDSVPGFDVLSLVTDAAAAIENALFQPADGQLVLSFHPRAELLGTPMQGLLLVDAEGRLAGANRMAARLLCQQRGQLIGRPFGALFDRRLPQAFGQMPRPVGGLVEMQTQVGLQVVARFECSAAPAAAADLLRELPPAAPDGAPPMPASLRSLECQAIEHTLAALGGNVSATAKALGISRNTIYRRRQLATRR